MFAWSDQAPNLAPAISVATALPGANAWFLPPIGAPHSGHLEYNFINITTVDHKRI